MPSVVLLSLCLFAPPTAGDVATPEAPVLRVGALSGRAEPSRNTSQGLYIQSLRAVGMEAHAVSAEAVRAGALEELDVFIFGGGSGTKFAASLGEEGCDLVEEFVRRGGGVMSNCAGSFAFVRGYNDATEKIEIANARCLPATDGRLVRGKGTLELETRDETTPELKMFYANGPVWEITDAPGFGETRALAWYRTEALREGDEGGVMPGSPAILGGTFGAGRFVLFSAHPEFHWSLGNVPLIPDAARWVARGPLGPDEPITYAAVFPTPPNPAAPAALNDAFPRDASSPRGASRSGGR